MSSDSQANLSLAYLRLNGVNAKAHPVFDELTRVKQYFQKIKVAESAETQQNTRLDKAAAGRFIKHALVSYCYYVLSFTIADIANRLEMTIVNKI